MSLGRGSTGTRRSPPSSSSSPEAIDPGTKALQHTLALIPIGIPIRNERVRRFRCILGRWLLAEAEALSCLVVAATGFDLRIRPVLRPSHTSAIDDIVRAAGQAPVAHRDRKSTRLNSSH